MGYQPPGIPGWMNNGELAWLYAQAQEVSSIVEVGSWKGKSAHALLSGCPGPVFCVDHFQGNPNELASAHKEATVRDIAQDFWTNVGHFKNLALLRMDSIKAAGFFKPGSVEMVFIDGCHVHDAVVADLMAWKPVCGKLLCGHDASVVKEALKAMKLDYENPVDRIWSVTL